VRYIPGMVLRTATRRTPEPTSQESEINDRVEELSTADKQRLLEFMRKLQDVSDAVSTEPTEEINHPKHYNLHPAGIEAIEVIEHFTFNVGTAAKYLWRAGLKVSPNGDERDARIRDLKKAAWYIDREIDRLNAEKK
jgi:Protein of unknwon function (DUF3310)